MFVHAPNSSSTLTFLILRFSEQHTCSRKPGCAERSRGSRFSSEVQRETLSACNNFHLVNQPANIQQRRAGSTASIIKPGQLTTSSSLAFLLSVPPPSSIPPSPSSKSHAISSFSLASDQQRFPHRPPALKGLRCSVSTSSRWQIKLQIQGR